MRSELLLRVLSGHLRNAWVRTFPGTQTHPTRILSNPT
jgi:hypothetical protein